MRRLSFIFCIACFGAQTASADPVTDVCLSYDAAEVCECASEALKKEIGYKHFVQYSVASKTALEHQEAGDALAVAWDKATKRHAIAAGLSDTEALNQMNEFGAAHRDAIKKCKG